MPIFMKKSLFDLMNDEERRSFVCCVMKKGDFFDKRYLLEKYFPNLTNEERRALVQWAVEKDGYSANSAKFVLLKNYFSYLMNEERRSLVGWVMEKEGYSAESAKSVLCEPQFGIIEK
jgi:hypothetical protein